MNAWKLALVGILITLAAFLGAQACAAVMVGAAVIVCGPKRLRSLPNAVRNEAATQLMMVLLASGMTLALSVVSLAAGNSLLGMMAVLAGWLGLGMSVLFAAFHFESYTAAPRVTRKVYSRPPAFEERRLPWAS